MANRLAGERSRYLRQHAHNPVRWYPYGTEAFETARGEGKPILLSIGYSSCHWCHVMAHESFEHAATAAFLNERFVSVKVDKEEHPDVDGFYMDYVSRLTGNGGWPLHVVVNPNGAPFFGFTYLPNERFRRILQNVADRYREMPELREKELRPPSVPEPADDDEVRLVVANRELPGLSRGSGPQFPFGLYAAYLAAQDERAEVAGFLENSITKGLFDQIQGGWFRYTVDSEWKVPHFEKMLYDQATLLYLCARVYTENPELCDYAIRVTVRWLREHMRLPNGLYGSATDADTEDGEGFYYTIPETDDPAVRSLYRLDQAGTHQGRYVPWIDRAYLAAHPEESEHARGRYERERQKLIPPGLDDKAVVAWNAFLGYAFQLCYERLGDPEFLELAERLHESLSGFVAGGEVPHAVYGTESAATGREYLSDYAAYLLFTARLSRLHPEFVPEAKRISAAIEGKFLTPDWLFHTADRRFESASLWQDTPFPSGGSLYLNALLELESETAVPVFRACSGIVRAAARNPEFFAFWLEAFSRYHAV
jgi:uncharacterized protein YyaL (SSP411 family)